MERDKQLRTADLARARDEMRGRGVTVNCLHPSSLMPTKMVVGRFGVQSTLEEGVRNTVSISG